MKVLPQKSRMPIAIIYMLDTKEILLSKQAQKDDPEAKKAVKWITDIAKEHIARNWSVDEL